MLINPQAEQFFLTRSAHSDLALELLAALKKRVDCEPHGNLAGYGAPYFVCSETVFCGATGMVDTYWRLRQSDYLIAIATGAEPAPIGPDWVKIVLFRADWPRPDLAHWVLKAYDFARSGK